jgi:hypothetical protein
MLKNLLKRYCIWTWDTVWFFFVCVCAVLFYFIFPLWWDNYKTSETPSPGLEAEGWTPKWLRLKLHCNWTWSFFLFSILFYLYIYIYVFSFIYLFFIFILIFILFIFLFSILCLSNAFSAYGWLAHCLSMFISLKLSCLFVCFFLLFCFVFQLDYLFFPFP